jgi:hypothetical protein
LLGTGAKRTPFKLVLAFHFDISHDHGQQLFMNVNSRYPVRHQLLLAGAESVPQLALTRVAGYRRSEGRRDNAQLFAQSRTLQIRQWYSLNFSIAASISPPLSHRHCALLEAIFMRFRGPKALPGQWFKS